MLGNLMMAKLNELRLKNVQCDLELVSSDNKSFNIHQIVFTALNRKHFQLAVQQAYIYSSDIRMLSKKKMYLSHLSSAELEMLIDFMYGATVTKKRKYDLLLSALGKMDMVYLLNEVGGFTFDNDSPIKTEIDVQTDIQEMDVDCALQNIGNFPSRNELTIPSTANTEPVNDNIGSSEASADLSPHLVKEEPESPVSELVIWSVKRTSCCPVSNSASDVPRNEKSDQFRKQLYSVGDDVNESLLQDLKEEIASDSETVEKSFDMYEIERVYQKVKQKLDGSVMTKEPIGTENDLTISELDTIGESLSASSTTTKPMDASDGTHLEPSNESHHIQSSAIRPMSVFLPTTEPNVNACSDQAIQPDQSAGNTGNEPETSNPSNECVNVVPEDIAQLSHGQTEPSSEANGTSVIFSEISMTHSLTSMTRHAANESVDCHIHELSSSLSTSSNVSEPCKTVYSSGVVKSSDSSPDTSVSSATTSTYNDTSINQLQFLSLPVDVSSSNKSNLTCTWQSHFDVRPDLYSTYNVICVKTSEQQTSCQSTSVSNDKKSKQALIKSHSDDEVTYESIYVASDDQGFRAENNMGDKFTDEMNREQKEVVAHEQSSGEVNNELKQVTDKDQFVSGNSVMNNKSKQVVTKEDFHVEVDNEPCMEDQSTCELDCEPKLIIVEEQCAGDVNNESLQLNDDQKFSELSGECSRTVTKHLLCDELTDASNQVGTIYTNQSIQETNKSSSLGSVRNIPSTSTTLSILPSIASAVDLCNYKKLRPKSSFKVGGASCCNKTTTKLRQKAPNNNTSSMISDSKIAHTSQSAMFTTSKVALADSCKQPILSQKEIKSSVSNNVKGKKAKVMKKLKKYGRKPLFKKSSKQSPKNKKFPILTDILNCRSKNIYCQIKELEFEKVDGTSPSDLAECEVLTENATAFLKESIQNVDTYSGSQINILRKSQADQPEGRMADVGSVDTIEPDKQSKGKVKHHHDISVELKAVTSKRNGVKVCMSSNKSSGDVMINNKDKKVKPGKEIFVIDDESEKEANKQFSFLSQEETPIKSSSDECIIPASEVLSLTPAQLVKNYQTKVENARKNNSVKDNSLKTSEKDRSVSARTKKSNGNQMTFSASSDKAEPMTNNCQSYDHVSSELKANPVSDVMRQRSNVFGGNLKSVDLSVKNSMTVCSSVNSCTNMSTVKVSPVQSFANHLSHSGVGQPHAILPKVPVTLIRFPLRILSHSIQTGKHVIQVDHPTISSTSISPICSNTLLTSSHAKFARKRWKSMPDSDLLRKRKSIQETVGFKDFLVDEGANEADSKKRKLKDSNMTDGVVEQSALDSDLKTIDQSMIEIEADESIVMPDNTGTLDGDSNQEVQEFVDVRSNEKFEENDLGGDVEIPLSKLKLKLFDGSSQSNNITSAEDSVQHSSENEFEGVSTDTLQPNVVRAGKGAACSVSSNDNEVLENVSILKESELEIKEEPNVDKETSDSDMDFKALDEDDIGTKMKYRNVRFVSSKLPKKTYDGLKVKLFSNLKRRKQYDEEISTTCTTASDDVIPSKVSLTPSSLKSCRSDLSEIRKQIAAQRARRSHLSSKMVLVNGKPSRQKSCLTSKFYANALVFKSEPLDNIQTVGIVSGTSSVQVLGKNSRDNPEFAISTCSKSSTVVSYVLKRPCPSTQPTAASTSVVISSPNYTISTTPSSQSMKSSEKKNLSPVFAPLPIASHSVVPVSSSNAVVLLPSSLQTFTSVTTMSPISVKAIDKSPTPVLSSLLSSRPLLQTQTQNCDTVKASKPRKVRKYKKKIPSDKTKDNVKKKRARVSKKNKAELPSSVPAVHVLQSVGTPPHLASNHSPYRQILPKLTCVAFVMKPAFEQVDK